MKKLRSNKTGFTLVELSIVIVIIGLIVGSILVGRELIEAAQIRSQISQIEQFQTAANTFKLKYGYLPGDIPATPAAAFGFAARGASSGQGDGNGIIEGGTGGTSNGFVQCQGETGLFWVDLSQAGLIDQKFNSATATGHCTGGAVTGAAIGTYLPSAKLTGQIAGNYVVVWSGGINWSTLNSANNGINYLAIFGVSGLNQSGWGSLTTTPSMTPVQAYNIDTKIDDGKPRSGKTQTLMVGQAGAGGVGGASSGNGTYRFGATPGTAAAASATTCYDNGNVASNDMQYSTGSISKSNFNCMLSINM